MTRDKTPTIVFIPDLSGTPWNVDGMAALSHRSRRTMRLPDLGDTMTVYADFVEMKTIDLDQYVLVGDGFGASVAVAVAVRQPKRLRGLVLTGELTISPASDKHIKLMIRAARRTPQPLFKSRFIGRLTETLAFPFDTVEDAVYFGQTIRELYEAAITRNSILRRLRALSSQCHAALLPGITVPTLVLCPQHNPLLGNGPARVLLAQIPRAEGGIVRSTGPMLRFTHPVRLGQVINRFLVERLDPIRDETIERWYARHSVDRGLVGTSVYAILEAEQGSGLLLPPSRVGSATLTTFNRSLLR